MTFGIISAAHSSTHPHNSLRKLRIAVACLAATVLASCVDDRSPIAPEGPRLNALGAGQEPANDMDVQNRFELNVDVNGSLKPGQPIQLTLRGTANFATKDADVRVSLPEVAAAKESGWDTIELPVGVETRPHIQLRRAWAKGESFRQRATITIPEPGYYLVMATAKQHSDDANTDLPNMVGDVSARELWLWIDEHGGRVTETFDTTLFGPDVRKSRGPLGKKDKAPRIRKKDPQPTCNLTPADPVIIVILSCPGTGAPPPPPPPSTTGHSFQLVYDRAGTGHATQAVPWARFEYTVRTTTGSVVTSGSGFADASGGLGVIECGGPPTERNIEVKAFSSNNKTSVIYGAGTSLAGGYNGTCGGTTMITLNRFQAQVFLNMVLTADGHYTRFGQAVPVSIPVRLNDSGKTNYEYSIPEVRIAALDQMVFGEYGVMVAAHEWGHMWQDKYLKGGASDGLMRYYDRSCPDPHPIANATSFGCAFGEGFADWYAVVVREADLPTWKDHLERNFYYTTCQNIPNTVRCSDDGSIVQGAIHAFLWDLVDPVNNETHDQIQFTPFQVMDVVRTCSVTLPNGSRIWYDGIDHLIFCMTQRSPYLQKVNGSTVTLFNTRPKSAWPTDVTGSTLQIGSVAIRQNWMANLYSNWFGTNPTISIQEPQPEPEGEPEPQPEPCADPRALIC